MFATWLHNEGVPTDAVSELLGHKNFSTTERYITKDRVKAGKHLLSMPRIEIGENKVASGAV